MGGMQLREKLVDFFAEQIGPGRRFENSVRMAAFLGLPATQATKFYNFLKGADTQYGAVLDWLEKLEFRLLFPHERKAEREVCFVDARMAQAGDGAPPPQAENYLAVPLVGEVGAGPGIIPRDEILSWVLVYREHRSVNRRSNLLAVEVGRNQRSMIPTLHPGDIVLVDRDDWGNGGYAPPGNIFLVREPGQEGGGKVKRVATAGKGELATITFYSDNAAEYGPEVFHAHQYDHDLRQAIVGRVVWAWADLSRK